jgi:hypothetical protein
MTGPPVDATVHRRAAGSVDFSETGTARRNDPILVAKAQGYAVTAELAHQAFQCRRRVRDPTVFPNLAAQPTLGYRDDNAFLVNIKPDVADTIRHDPSPMHAARHQPIRCNPRYLHTVDGSPRAQADMWSSLIERQNLTMRMSMRRFTRLTNAFSKKIENLWAAVSLHFAHYNFVRVHRSLRVTPAMEAGISTRLWTLGELVGQTSA